MQNHKPNTIFIWGLGREGWSSLNYLQAKFPDAKFVLTDDKNLTELDEQWQQLINQNPQIEFVTTIDLDEKEILRLSGSQREEESDKLDNASDGEAANWLTNVWVIKSAGIPPHHPFHATIKKLGLTVTTNIKLFFEFASDHQVQTIGVSGTKGKSTTSSLIYHVMAIAGLPVVFGGNIGTPPLDLVGSMEDLIQADAKPWVVLEMSSHQLSDMTQSPHIAVIQNITPEHLDYYATFEEYAAAKRPLCAFQNTTDYVIFNSHYHQAQSVADTGQAQQLTFSIVNQTKLASDAAYADPNQIYWQDQPLISRDQITLMGDHNLDNILPSVVIAKLLKIPDQDLVRALKSFEPLPHRLELVFEKNGIKYINDSLSTTPVATIAALQALANQPIVLLAGGYDRGLDYADLAKYLQEHPVTALILFAPSGERIAKLLNGVSFPVAFASDMKEAIALANQHVKTHGVVLLSPASASFGKYRDYAQRGQDFARLAREN